MEGRRRVCGLPSSELSRCTLASTKFVFPLNHQLSTINQPGCIAFTFRPTSGMLHHLFSTRASRIMFLTSFGSAWETT